MKNIPVRKLSALALAAVVILSLFAGFACAESAEPFCVYEAIFLDNARVASLFAQVRGEDAPYDAMTQDFHVTTAFMPAQPCAQWYGTPVTVHITAYKAQQVSADDGSLTANEGFKAELTAADPALQAYLTSLGKNFHITGSYMDQAKYTEAVDFTDAQPLDITITGTFGCYLSDSTFCFIPEAA